MAGRLIARLCSLLLRCFIFKKMQIAIKVFYIKNVFYVLYKSFLYKKMRNAEYDCDCRVVNQFPTMEEALDWEKKLIKRTP